jgi:hypothetical protein
MRPLLTHTPTATSPKNLPLRTGKRKEQDHDEKRKKKKGPQPRDGKYPLKYRYTTSRPAYKYPLAPAAPGRYLARHTQYRVGPRGGTSAGTQLL